MVTDIIRKVERWSDHKKLPVERKNVYVNMARMYQRGDPLPPKEEALIGEILTDMNPEDTDDKHC